MKTVWERFKHRNIAKIATAYAVVGWLMLQVIEIVLPTFNAPQWIAQTIIFVVIMGFPIALLIAWASEIKSGRYEKASNEETSGLATENKTAAAIPNRLFYGVGAISISVIGLFAFYVSTVLFNVDNRGGSTVTQESEGGITPTIISRAPVRSHRFELNLGNTGVHPAQGFRTDLSLSPDGNYLAYVNNLASSIEIFLKDLRSLDPARLLATATRGVGVGRVSFSEDGEWVLFIGTGGLMHRVRFEGGAAQQISNIPTEMTGIASFDNLYLYTDDSGSLIKSNFTGEILGELSSNDGGKYNWPKFLPGGEFALVTERTESFDYSSSRIAILDVASMETTALIETAFNASYVPTGHIVFARDSALWAVPFDVETLSTTGNQVPVILEIETDTFGGTATYTFSDGRLIYLPGMNVAGSLGGYGLTTISRSGRLGNLDLLDQQYGHLAMSPTRNELALTIYGEGDSTDVWVLDLDRNIFGRRTFDGLSSRSVYSPDGNQLIYFTRDVGLQTISADGTGEPQMLFATDELFVNPDSVSPDGDIIFTMGGSGNTGAKLYRLPADSSVNSEVIAEELELAPVLVPYNGAQISPDGNWIAYASDETGVAQVYVRPYPSYSLGKWQASIDPGFQPIWSRNANELFYWTFDQKQIVVPYEPLISNTPDDRRSVRFGIPSVLSEIVGVRGPNSIPSWIYMDEVDEFLMITSKAANINLEEQVLSNQTVLTVVDNWYEELISLAPSTAN